MHKQIEKDIVSERIVQVIKTIYDPEIPVNIYDLGLIYSIRVDDDFVAHITMTLTAPNCPVAESLPIYRARLSGQAGPIRFTDELRGR